MLAATNQNKNPAVRGGANWLQFDVTKWREARLTLSRLLLAPLSLRLFKILRDLLIAHPKAGATMRTKFFLRQKIVHR